MLKVQSGDWKGEKHVPIIHAPKSVKKGEAFELKVTVGDEIAHPNTLEHHIAWFKVYFVPTAGQFPVEIGNFEFRAHGEGGIFDEPHAATKVKLDQSGHFHVLSYCNIHGLWDAETEIKVNE